MGNRFSLSHLFLMKDGEKPARLHSTKSASGSPIVAMVQPSESWLRHDPTGSGTGNSAGRCLLRESKMRAVFVVVPDVLGEQPFQMAYMDRDDMV